MNSVSKIYRAIVLSPLLWGAAATAVFYGLLFNGAPASVLSQGGQAFLERYCANRWDILGGGWVLVAEIGAFFVGMAALAVKRFEVAEQFAGLTARPLGAVPPGGQTAHDCPSLLTRLDQLSSVAQESYLVRRLRNALSHILRKGSAEALDQELKTLADLDDSQAHGNYALVRIIIWAIPILGFLGTVIGITMAIGQLNPKELESSLHGVINSLGVAFDTTALALTLSMFLMFTMFAVDKSEQRLLASVNQGVDHELSQRFLQNQTAGHPEVAIVRRMAESVIESTSGLVQRQAELWQATITESQSRWSQTIESAYGQVERALSQATAQALQSHAQQVIEANQVIAQQNHQHLAQMQQTIAQNLQAMRDHQQQLMQQAEVLRSVVEATGGVSQLEETLNRNLAALSASHNFEETLASLAAVIHLLNARLSHSPERGRIGAPSTAQANVTSSDHRPGRAA